MTIPLECVCVCVYVSYVLLYTVYIHFCTVFLFIYFWCNKYVRDPYHTFWYSPFWQTVVVLLHKHFLYIPSPFFNSASIITNCQYAAMSKHNVTIYEGYPESKLRLLILPPQHCGHKFAHALSFLILWQGTETICRHSNGVNTSCCVYNV